MRLNQLHVVGGVALALVCVLVTPNVASTASALAGVVLNSAGRPLPGVTVEAAGAASLTTAVTDGHGRYLMTDLAPGVYAVTFTLQGFHTVIHRGIGVEPDCLVPLDARMVLRALGTGLIVTGSPVGGVAPARVTMLAPQRGRGVLPQDPGRLPAGRPSPAYLIDSCRAPWLRDLATFLGHHECLLAQRSEAGKSGAPHPTEVHPE